MPHLFPKKVSEVANGLEQQFFKIEREDRWMACLINGLIAGAAVAIVSWLVLEFEAGLMQFPEGDLLLFACLGSSSAAIVFAPVAKTNSLRSIIVAYLSSVIVCITMYPLRNHVAAPLPVQCFLAVTLSIFLMRLADAMHPAAVGSAMAFIIFDQRDFRSLVMLILAIIGLLAIVKMLAYIYLEELTFRNFPREFRRTYYGAEMTVTLQPPAAGESKNVAEPDE